VATGSGRDTPRNGRLTEEVDCSDALIFPRAAALSFYGVAQVDQYLMKNEIAREFL
jgi:hypothetical protein